MVRLKIAFRNVLRNRRRTILSVGMIAVGIAAIIVIQGFTQNQLNLVQNIAINSQYGNLQIADRKHWHLSTDDSPKQRLSALPPEIEAKIQAIPSVRYVSGRISFFGLLSSGEHSLSSHGIGFDPDREIEMHDSLPVISGTNFSHSPKFEIMIGSGLQEQLQAKIGSSLTIIGYTFDGSMNAVDCQLVGVFQTSSAEIDNSTFYVPLSTAQVLLDTDLSETYVVQLADREKTDAVNAQISSFLPANFETRTWLDLAVIFRQIANFDRVQSTIAITIVLLVSLMAIANTVGMSISERIGEIGTVRAIGDFRSDILKQFLLEGLILGLLGGVSGCALGFIVTIVMNYMKIPVFFPGASRPSVIVVDFIPLEMIKAVIMASLTAVVASFVPALSATRLKIVEALRRNI